MNKRFARVLSVLVMTALFFSMSALAAPYEEDGILIGGPALLGDIDENGVVGADDALNVLKLSVGLLDMTLNDLQKSLNDLNESGAIDAIDALMILQTALALREEKTTDSLSFVSYGYRDCAVNLTGETEYTATPGAVVIRSVDQLTDLREKQMETSSMDADQAAQLAAALDGYDAAYFETHSLIVVSAGAPGASYGYSVRYLRQTSEGLTIGLNRFVSLSNSLNYGLVVPWTMLVEVDGQPSGELSMASFQSLLPE